MKTLVLTYFFLALACVPLIAQETNRVQVANDQDMQTALQNQVYRFPSFKKGKVVLPNGKSNTALLNFNLLSGQMQFIDDKKDTLTILSPDILSYVEIDSIKFIHHEDSFLEILGDYEPWTLAVSRKIKIADKQREGAYGTKTSSASIGQVSTGYSPNTLLKYNPSVYEDLLVNTVQAFYLLDKKANANIVNKRNVLHAFPTYKAQLNDYLKQNKVDFKKEDDVRELLRYATEN